MTLTQNLVKLYSHVSPRRRWQLVGLSFLMLLSAAAEMASLGAVVPFLSLLADSGLAGKYLWLDGLTQTLGASQESMAFYAALLFAIISLGAGFVRIVLMWVSLRFSFGLGADLGSEVYCSTLYRPYSWHVSHNSSEILAGVEKVNAVVYNIINPLIQGLVALVLVIGIIAALLAINPQVAVLAGAGFALMYGIVSLLLNRLLVRNSQVVSENMTNRVQAIQEGLGGIRDVLLDGAQPIYNQRFASFDGAMRRAQATNALIGASPRYVIESTGMVLIAGLAFWLTGQQGGLAAAIPVLGALAIGAQKLLPQMQLVYYSWASISSSRDQLADTLQLLAAGMPVPENLGIDTSLQIKPQACEKKNVPLIRLHDVGFQYKMSMPQALHQINLDIPMGACVGFVGKTGSGKSTLIDLVMALLEPTQGYIEIDGQRLTHANHRDWQKRIAHVPQAIYLSDSSIAENIAFGISADQTDFDRVKSAARKAQLSDYIEGLPEQYQTQVGERGVRLSGGQRQRIGLARALYKQADILVLDEATSALDNMTEHAVMEAIMNHGKSLTVLIVAHRISTLQHCDLIVDLANGSIVRQGDYRELFGTDSIDKVGKYLDA